MRLVIIPALLACSLSGLIAADPPAAKAMPYPLDTCPVSGEKLDQHAVTKTYGDREVKFCCAKCAAKYEANRAMFDQQIDLAARAKAGERKGKSSGK